MTATAAQSVWLSLALVTATGPARTETPSQTPPPAVEPSGEQTPPTTLERAVELFERGEFEAAIVLFEEAYAEKPEPNYLFNIGRVYEELGNTPQAIEYYERFVSEPEANEDAKDMVRLRLSELTQAEQQTPPPPPPPPDPPKPVALPSSTPRTQTPPLRIAGYAAMGSGALVLALGGAFAGAAMVQHSRLEDLSMLEPRRDAVQKGERNALVADSLFITGGVVLTTGLILTLVSLRKSGGRRHRR